MEQDVPAQTTQVCNTAARLVRGTLSGLGGNSYVNTYPSSARCHARTHPKPEPAALRPPAPTLSTLPILPTAGIVVRDSVTLTSKPCIWSSLHGFRVWIQHGAPAVPLLYWSYSSGTCITVGATSQKTFSIVTRLGGRGPLKDKGCKMI